MKKNTNYSYRPHLPIGRLEFLVERLRLIAKEEEKSLCRLAELGIIIKPSDTPQVRTGDTEQTACLKERLLRFQRERQTIKEEISRTGTLIRATETFEVLFPGGPEQGSYLSWQPGEPELMFWREDSSFTSERKLLVESVEQTSIILH